MRAETPSLDFAYFVAAECSLVLLYKPSALPPSLHRRYRTLFTSISAMANKTCEINVPGYWLEQDCTLICRETRWTDLAVFYLGNYVAHVATRKSLPGEIPSSSSYQSIVVLLFPVYGMFQALELMSRFSTFAPTALQKAARAQALLMVKAPTAESSVPVIEDISPGILEDQPQEGVPLATVGGSQVNDSVSIIAMPVEEHGLIHGRCELPPGYSLELVPADASFLDDEPDAKSWFMALFTKRQDKKTAYTQSNYNTGAGSSTVRPGTHLACTQGNLRILVSVIQLAFAISTLVRTRRDQVERYGYAAYGLTVIPYAWMSLINLCAHFMEADYTTKFIVESSSLKEARRLHPTTCIVTGTIGELEEPYIKQKKSEKGQFVGALIAMLSVLVPFTLLAVLTSKFSPGASTLPQRAWTMSWFVSGFALIVIGALVSAGNLCIRLFGVLLGFGAIASCIGGFVVVGQMIMEVGSCTRLAVYN